MFLRSTVALGFAMTVVGCLPARDNPYDPQNAADVEVRVVDLTKVLTPEGRDCALVTDSGSFLVVSAASRGRCLALEAFGETLDDYRFSLVSTGGSAVLDVEIEPVTGTRVALADEVLRGWPVDVPLTFELRGRDLGGNRARARTSLVLLNARPVVAPDPLRVLPQGGFPWTPGAPFDVAFAGSDSWDADGDPLDVCFRFPGEKGEACRASGDPPLVRSVASTSTSGSFVAEVWARDGVAESARAVSVVRVGDPPAWIGAASGAGRLDPDRRSVSVPVPFAGLALVGTEPERIAQLGNEIVLIDPDAVAEIDSFPVHPDGYGYGHWDRSRKILWTVNPGSSFGVDAAAEAWRVEADQLVPDRPRRILAQTPLNQADNAWGLVLDTDADGDLWMAPLGDDVVFRTAWADTASNAVALPAPIAAVAVRPDADGNPTEETWVLVGDGEAATLLRIEDDATAQTVAYVENGPDCGALAWIDASEFWLIHPVRGALRVDADRLAETGLLEAAILVEAPLGYATAGRTDSWVVERDTGSIVLVVSSDSFQAGRTLRVSIDGRVESSVGDDNAKFGVMDSRGRIWYSSVGGGGGPPLPVGRRGRTTGKFVDLFTATPLEYGGSQTDTRTPDPTTGGYWALTRRPSIARVFADGRFEELTGAQDANGAAITPPTLGSLSVSPDGTTAWALAADPPDYFEATGVYRIDLRTVPPTYTRMPFDPAVSLPLLQAAGPDGSHALYRETLGLVERVAVDGTRTPFRTLGPGESGAIEFDAAATGGACLAVPYDDSGTDSTRIEWIDAAGASTELGIYPVMSGMGIPGGVRGVEAVLAADGSPVCWLLRADNLGFSYADLSAWDGSGLLHERLNAQLPIDGGASGPYAAGPNDVWITDGAIGEVGNGTTEVIHLVFDPAGSFQSSERFTENGLRKLVR